MPVTYSQAKIIVARTIGGANDPDQIAAAGDAIAVAISEWNLRQKWNFLLVDNSTDPVDIVTGTDLYQLPASFREMLTVRLVSKKKTLYYLESRQLDRVVRDQSPTAIPDAYLIFRGATDFAGSSESSQAPFIKLYPSPNYTLANELLLRYYRRMLTPTLDADFMDIPDRYVYALLTTAKYFYLVDKDAESERTAHHRQVSEMLFKQAERDDQEYQDDDLRLIPQNEYGTAWGPAPENVTYWWDI